MLAWLRSEEARLAASEAAPDAPDDPPTTPPAPRRRRKPAGDRTAAASPAAAAPAEAPPLAPDATGGAAQAPEPSGLAASGKYMVPQIGPRGEQAVRVAAVGILAYWVYYIVWRWTDTLNPDALWFSLPLVLAETWGLLTAIFLVATAWRLNHRMPVAPEPGLSVDVFITTYDEPLEIIRRTAISAREIRYPHRTYVLDDGRRDEVQSMAEELGVGYLRRGDNLHAKAGNLNHALQHTEGDFILQLDADHAPLPHFLDRTLGFFRDPDLAFVQTPQDFYNTDSFTSDISEDEQRLWEEQRLFFAVIQPGKDTSNSSFFCGSCAVIRRAALEEMGGFSTESITEDIETSLQLHGRGWRSAYYGESLAYGLAAGSADAFHTQHRRWARGAMQVIRRFNPLTYPGLTPGQRLGYFYSLTAYVIGLQKLVFYAAPIVFFLTGALPIRAIDSEFLLRFVPYLILSIALAEMLARGLGFTWLVERYQMAKFWTYSTALATLFTNRRLTFSVTPKGRGQTPVHTYLPQLVLMVLTVLSVNWATVAYAQDWIDYGVDGWDSLAFQANFLWALLNFVLAAYVVRLSVRLQQHRQDHRFSDQLPISVRVRGPRGRLGEREIALTEDLNAGGLRFRSVARFEPGTELKLELPLSTAEVGARGVVVHVQADAESVVEVSVHGVEFVGLPLEVRDAIELHCAQHAVPSQQLRFKGSPSMLHRAQEWARDARGETRRRVRLPAEVRVSGDGWEREEIAFLEEVSRGGARLIMSRPVSPEDRIDFQVPGTELRGLGRAVFSRALETPIGVRFAVGVRRDGGIEPDSGADKRMRISRLWRTAGSATALALALSGQPITAAAQLETAVFGAAEVDTEDMSLVLLGASISPAGLGWKPVGTLVAYQLNVPIGGNQYNVTAINPSAGIRYQMPYGAVQGQVGYLFLSGDDVRGFGAPGGSEEGVTASLQGDYWGTGVRTAQAIANYNFGDGYLWARGRGAQQVATVGSGAVRVGGEIVGQGENLFDSDETTGLQGYSAIQLGLLAEYQLTPSFRLIGVVGGKSDNIADNPDLFPYFKAEFVLLP